MSEGSSPISPSRPILASEPMETVTPVSHLIGLSEVTTFLETLSIKVDKKPTSYSPGVSRTPGSPSSRDHWKSSPVQAQKPRRYALQIWLEVEMSPRLFLPPEDDSYSEDFTMEVLNHAYLGCTGLYLDRAGHMLAFYG